MPTDELVEGYVSEKEKVIFINASILRSKIPLFRLKALMIHEIAHAVIGGGHNSRWLKRMNEAEIIAENNNEADLSREIRCDVRNYEK
jgi:predicted metal-dependent peptidase